MTLTDLPLREGLWCKVKIRRNGVMAGFLRLVDENAACPYELTMPTTTGARHHFLERNAVEQVIECSEEEAKKVIHE